MAGVSAQQGASRQVRVRSVSLLGYKYVKIVKLVNMISKWLYRPLWAIYFILVAYTVATRPEILAGPPARVIERLLDEAIIEYLWVALLAITFQALERITAIEIERVRTALALRLYGELSLYGRLPLSHVKSRYRVSSEDLKEVIEYIEDVTGARIVLDPNHELRIEHGSSLTTP